MNVPRTLKWSAAVVVLAALVSLSAADTTEVQHAMGLILEDPRGLPDCHEIQEVLPDPGTPLASTVSEWDLSSEMPPVTAMGQGIQKSCVAWACGYFCWTQNQSHSYSLRHHGTYWPVNQTDHQISPAMVYNLINDGVDGGTVMSAAMRLICNNGPCMWSDQPYNQMDFTTWPSEQAWCNGIRNRGSSWGVIDMPSSNNNGIDAVKQLLLNGRTAVFGINVYDNFYYNALYNYTYCLGDTFGFHGCHGVCIVGYDDNRATRDGLGAFKLVNSWGDYWGDLGYWWMSYQAVSRLLCEPYAWYVTPKALPQDTDYEPRLLARVHVTHTRRYTVEIGVGVGDQGGPSCVREVLRCGGNPHDFDFPTNNLVFDMTEFIECISDESENRVFVGARDHTLDERAGTIDYVSIDMPPEMDCLSPNTPVSLPDCNSTLWCFATLPIGTPYDPPPTGLNNQAKTVSRGHELYQVYSRSFLGRDSIVCRYSPDGGLTWQTEYGYGLPRDDERDIRGPWCPAVALDDQANPYVFWAEHQYTNAGMQYLWQPYVAYRASGNWRTVTNLPFHPGTLNQPAPDPRLIGDSFPTSFVIRNGWGYVASRCVTDPRNEKIMIMQFPLPVSCDAPEFDYVDSTTDYSSDPVINVDNQSRVSVVYATGEHYPLHTQLSIYSRDPGHNPTTVTFSDFSSVYNPTASLCGNDLLVACWDWYDDPGWVRLARYTRAGSTYQLAAPPERVTDYEACEPRLPSPRIINGGTILCENADWRIAYWTRFEHNDWRMHIIGPTMSNGCLLPQAAIISYPLWPANKLATFWTNQSVEGNYSPHTEPPFWLPPPAPVLALPPMNGYLAIDQFASGTLTWNAASGATCYDVYLDVVPSPTAKVGSNVTDTNFVCSSLTSGRTYCWKVVAKNDFGENTSETWNFTANCTPRLRINPNSPTTEMPGSNVPEVILSSLVSDSSFGTACSMRVAQEYRAASETLPASEDFGWMGYRPSLMWHLNHGAGKYRLEVRFMIVGDSGSGYRDTSVILDDSCHLDLVAPPSGSVAIKCTARFYAAGVCTLMVTGSDDSTGTGLGAMRFAVNRPFANLLQNSSFDLDASGWEGNHFVYHESLAGMVELPQIRDSLVYFGQMIPSESLEPWFGCPACLSLV
jgi:C1A family cysteine protease